MRLPAEEQLEQPRAGQARGERADVWLHAGGLPFPGQAEGQLEGESRSS